MWKFRRKGAEITPKERVFKYLKRVDPEFQKIIFDTIDVYPELKRSFYSDSSDFFEKIRVEHDLTNGEQILFVKKVLDRYTKLLRRRHVDLVDANLLTNEKLEAVFPEIATLLEEQERALRSGDESY